MMSEVSIIIPTLNEQFFLPKILSSILGQKFKGRLEVIVVDGESEDKTLEVAQSFRGKFNFLRVFKAKRGVYPQRNLGARVAKYRHLLFLDADITLPPGFLNRFAAKIESDERAIHFALHLTPGFNPLDYLLLFNIYSFMLFSWLFGNPITSGSFTLTTKENHRKVGGFDNRAIMGGDVDYLWRSKRDGAAYHFHFWPHVYVSPRRARKEGRLGLLYKWLKCYFYMKRSGHPVYSKSAVLYTYGDYLLREQI